MFEKYFVTCPVAVALRGAGFDEPCMAARECYEGPDDIVDILHICYFSSPTNTDLYVETIRELLKTRPAMMNEKRTNKQLPPWLYAAPLYVQVFEWFEARGLYLHDYRITANVNRISKKTVYGTSVFDDQGMQLWPIITNLGDRDVFVKHSHDTLQLARDQAILAAIKLLPNEPKMDV